MLDQYPSNEWAAQTTLSNLLNQCVMLPSTEALLMSLYSHVAVSSKRSRNSENHKTWLNKEMPGLLYLLQTGKLLA